MSEKKFKVKVGDKIKCVGLSNWRDPQLELNKIYTVTYSDENLFRFDHETGDGRQSLQYYSDLNNPDNGLFELVEETSLGQGLLKGLKEAVLHENGEIKLRTSEGVKHDSNKAPMDLIPYESLEEIAKVLAAGEKKYTAGNWAKGLEMRRLLSAALRHIGQFNSGIDIDEETQTLHLANAACNLIFAIWMYKNRPDLDNRWIKELEKKSE